MKKKVLISLIGILGFLCGGLLITSFVMAKKIHHLYEERKDEPLVEFKGGLESPKLSPHKFRYVICDYFPVKVPSDTKADNSYGNALCDVTYKEEKLAMIYQPNYLQDLLSIFDHPVMSDLRDLSPREKLELIFESRGPGETQFLLTKKDLQLSLLYLVNGMHRKFKSWFKYTRGPSLIYVWDVSRGSFNELKVQVFNEQYSLTCMGPSCIEYLFQAGIL